MPEDPGGGGYRDDVPDVSRGVSVAASEVLLVGASEEASLPSAGEDQSSIHHPLTDLDVDSYCSDDSDAPRGVFSAAPDVSLPDASDEGSLPSAGELLSSTQGGVVDMSVSTPAASGGIDAEGAIPFVDANLPSTSVSLDAPGVSGEASLPTVTEDLPFPSNHNPAGFVALPIRTNWSVGTQNPEEYAECKDPDVDALCPDPDEDTMPEDLGVDGYCNDVPNVSREMSVAAPEVSLPGASEEASLPSAGEDQWSIHRGWTTGLHRHTAGTLLPRHQATTPGGQPRTPHETHREYRRCSRPRSDLQASYHHPGWSTRPFALALWCFGACQNLKGDTECQDRDVDYLCPDPDEDTMPEDPGEDGYNDDVPDVSREMPAAAPEVSFRGASEEASLPSAGEDQSYGRLVFNDWSSPAAGRDDFSEAPGNDTSGAAAGISRKTSGTSSQ
eukprot:jgi/Undpi1/8000/HiC_scaffold_24.g10472.m1